MDLSFSLEAVGLLTLLLPGFLASEILERILSRRSRDNFARLIEALVFSFLIYAPLLLIFGLPTQAGGCGQPLSLLDIVLVNRGYLLGSLVLAFVLPIALGFLHTTDHHMRWLRRLRITSRTARRSTWLDVFIEQQRYVIVNLSGRRRIFGWPLHYSDDKDDASLYLQNAAWIENDGTYVDLDAHGIFLVERDAIESIEFTHLTKENAQQRQSMEPQNGPPSTSREQTVIAPDHARGSSSAAQ